MAKKTKEGGEADQRLPTLPPAGPQPRVWRVVRSFTAKRQVSRDQEEALKLASLDKDRGTVRLLCAETITRTYIEDNVVGESERDATTFACDTLDAQVETYEEFRDSFPGAECKAKVSARETKPRKDT